MRYSKKKKIITAVALNVIALQYFVICVTVCRHHRNIIIMRAVYTSKYGRLSKKKPVKIE